MNFRSVLNKKFFYFFIIFILVLGFYPSFNYILSLINSTERERLFYIQLQESLLKHIQKAYVKADKINYEKLFQGALKGMFESLGDDYSYFLNTKNLRDLKENIKGNFGGIGVYVGYDEKKSLPYIEYVLTKGPAFKANLSEGDYITKVDGKDIKGLTLEESILKIKGPIGTKVKLEVLKATKMKPISIEIKRQKIVIDQVKYNRINKKIGYIQFLSFGESTYKQFKKALVDLTDKDNEHGAIDYLIIDLRNNRGGILEVSVNIADLFLKSGKIVYTKAREDKPLKVYKAKQAIGLNEKIPILILVNGITASASEIFVGALKDTKRATIIGNKTYGKGSVQEFFSFESPSGVQMGIRLTTQYYYTPAGILIDGKGILPDYKVNLPEIKRFEDYCQLEKLIQKGYLKKFLKKNNYQYTEAALDKFILELNKKSIMLPKYYIIKMLEINKQKKSQFSEKAILNLSYDLVLRKALDLINEKKKDLNKNILEF